MINDDRTFGHDPFQIAVKHGLANLEEHGEQDHILRKLRTFKRKYRLPYT